MAREMHAADAAIYRTPLTRLRVAYLRARALWNDATRYDRGKPDPDDMEWVWATIRKRSIARLVRR